MDEFNMTYAIDQQGGKNNAGYAEDVMMTILSDSHGTPHAVCYSIGSMNSEGMMSENPAAGIHEATVARTIDAGGTDPGRWQGGVAVIIVNEEKTICYAPEVNHCSGYREDQVSATLQTGYHYGGGGDAALILRRKDMLGPKGDGIAVYPVQNHPQDSRVTIEEDTTTVQTLNAKMGTGGVIHHSS